MGWKKKQMIRGGSLSIFFVPVVGEPDQSEPEAARFQHCRRCRKQVTSGNVHAML